MRIELKVNGEQREADVWEGESLLFALREPLDRDHVVAVGLRGKD